ncbi:hypothetical protein ACNQGB_02220 [Flavobacterium sp. XS1P32]|uniref:hypothetical protein n=1 Tax=Flavobacterium sp. XS1P32 TaxID=3401726 RepID=UPI003AAB3D42
MNKSLYALFFLCCFILCTSCDAILFEEDISTAKIVLVAPSDQAEFFTTGITFSWEKVSEATTYQLQIAKPDFSNPTQLVLDTIIKTSSFIKQLPLASYEWRVKALNTSYSTAYVSRKFTVWSDKDFASNTVVLDNPANNIVSKTALQRLTWQPIIGAKKYQIQIYDSNSVLVKEETVTTTSFEFSFAEGAFSWRVKAINGDMNTLYTSRAISVDTKAPAVAQQLAPLDKSETAVKEISFQWSRVAVAGTVEVDSIYVYTDLALKNVKLKNGATSPFTTTLEAGVYYWYIKSFDKAGNTSKSAIFSLKIL